MKIQDEKKKMVHINKRVPMRVLGAFLCVLMLALTVMTALPYHTVFADKISEGDIDELQQMLDALEKEKEDQQNQLEQMEADEARLQASLASYGSLAQLYYEQIEEVAEKKAECEEQLKNYEEQIAGLKEDQKELYDNFKLTLRVLRESRDVSALEMIFNADSLMELLSAFERTKDLSKYKKQLLSKIEESFSHIKEEKAAMEAELAKQTELGLRLDSMRADVEEQIAETEQYLTEITQQIIATENKLSELTDTTEEYEQELTDLIRRYEEQLEKERKARQTLLWPLDTKNKRLTSPYGYRYHPVTGKYKFHTGIDLAGPTSGSIKRNNIYASMDGVVITCVNAPNSKKGYGSYIVISHGYSERYGGNISTLYAHCYSVNVKKGQEVKQGDLIGTVGTSGSSTGYHLHYEVRKNGLTTDPMSYEYITALGGTPINPKKFVTGAYY
ncbi:MAG: peptidoglycan DD-metalloendopeptidase family protein [Clostridia bacterium]|nr:peptidoglycan DD-metalloendopeptidase family protein [Clostridia bacterium]MBQ8399509.1 peptidoglycan DD-metalloendopeptidase family protein [Clostridia bacterium]